MDTNLNEVRSKPKPIKLTVKRKGLGLSSPRGKIVKAVHEVMRAIVLDRDGHCVVTYPPISGHTGTRQAGHLITSTKGSVRFDLMNVHEQCSGCNARHEYHPQYYTDWFLEKFGVEEYRRLAKESEVVTPLKAYELLELLEQMNLIRQAQLENMAAVKEAEGSSDVIVVPFKPYFSQKDIMSGAWRNK